MTLGALSQQPCALFDPAALWTLEGPKGLDACGRGVASTRCVSSFVYYVSGQSVRGYRLTPLVYGGHIWT